MAIWQDVGCCGGGGHFVKAALGSGGECGLWGKVGVGRMMRGDGRGGEDYCGIVMGGR